MRAESAAREAHGCTVLVSTFCGNKLRRTVVCLHGNESSRWARAGRQRARALRPDPRYTAS
jgi:hypothetical protein